MRARICSISCSTLTASDRTLKSAMSVQERAIDDQHHRHHPEDDAGQQRAVVEQQVAGAATTFALMHEIEVAEDSVHSERNGQAQPRGAELLLGLRTDRVKDVSDQRRCGDDTDHLIKKVRRVLVENRSMRAGSAG